MDKEKILRLCDEIENDISDAWNSGAIEYELAGHIVSFAKKIAAEITAPPKSNADRIRQMTDEELAELIVSYAKHVSDVCQFYNVTKVSRIISWLRKETKSNEKF